MATINWLPTFFKISSFVLNNEATGLERVNNNIIVVPLWS